MKKHTHAPKTVPQIGNPPLGAGESRYQIIESKSSPDSVKVIVEYQAHASKAQGVAEAIYVSMFNAAMRADIAMLAKQRADEVIEGELLTPGGDAVLLKWLTTDDADVLIPIEGREATDEDRLRLPEFGESILVTQVRQTALRAQASGIQIASSVPK